MCQAVVFSQVATPSFRFVFKTKKGHLTVRISDVFQRVVFRLTTKEYDLKQVENNPFEALNRLIAKGEVPKSYSPPACFVNADKATCVAAVEDLKQQFPGEIKELSSIILDIDNNRMEEAISRLKKISSTDFQIVCVLIIMYVVIKKTEEDAFSLIKEAKNNVEQKILLYEHLLLCFPDCLKVYLELSVLQKNPAQKAHVLIRGALQAIQGSRFDEAQEFCDRAHKIYSSSFIDRLVDVFLAQQKNRSPLERWEIYQMLIASLGKYPMPSDSQPLIQLYEMLIDLSYTPVLCVKVIQWYLKKNLIEKALKWLRVLKQSQVSGEPAQDPPVKIKGDPKSGISGLLEHVPDSATPKLWLCLGKIYVDSDELGNARECFQNAYNKLATFETATQLAAILAQLGRAFESIQLYYEAAKLAGLDIEKVANTIASIKSMDPNMESFSYKEKQQLAIYEQRVELDEDLRILRAQQAPQAHAFLVEMPPPPPVLTIPPTKTPFNIYIGMWLKTWCPIFRKPREEMYHQVFIPPGLTLEKVLDLAQSKGIEVVANSADLAYLKGVSIEQGYWMAIASMTVPSSIACDRDQQQQLMCGGEFPKVIELLYFSISSTNIRVEHSRCQEIVDGDMFFKFDGKTARLIRNLLVGTTVVYRFDD